MMFKNKYSRETIALQCRAVWIVHQVMKNMLIRRHHQHQPLAAIHQTLSPVGSTKCVLTSIDFPLHARFVDIHKIIL